MGHPRRGRVEQHRGHWWHRGSVGHSGGAVRHEGGGRVSGLAVDMAARAAAERVAVSDGQEAHRAAEDTQGLPAADAEEGGAARALLEAHHIRQRPRFVPVCGAERGRLGARGVQGVRPRHSDRRRVMGRGRQGRRPRGASDGPVRRDGDGARVGQKCLHGRAAAAPRRPSAVDRPGQGHHGERRVRPRHDGPRAGEDHRQHSAADRHTRGGQPGGTGDLRLAHRLQRP
mmetsp:Transcript_37550/g.107453  ORF Transcript_37550/g.107453 Transcript_37550/m.107453 type:complete len:229 (+) Transcript_37550:805-1491(+)